MLEKILTQRNVSLKVKITIKSLVSAGLVTLACVLPQLVHLIAGAVGGVQWLPMYLPVVLAGCLLGTWWGLGVGIMSPIVSFLFTSLFGNPMPVLDRLPFMICELAMFAFVSGLFSKYILKNVLWAFPAVLFAEVIGRSFFLLLVLIFDSVTSLSISMVWAQVQTGMLAVILQSIIVPLIVIALSTLIKRDGANE